MRNELRDYKPLLSDIVIIYEVRFFHFKFADLLIKIQTHAHYI